MFWMWLGCQDTIEKKEPLEEGVILKDVDNDGYLEIEDCDDNNPDINPSSTEICDGIDNNCNGSVDEGVLNIYFADGDGDGFGNIDIQTQSCEIPDGYVSHGTDCDDLNDMVYPGAEEVCDGFDNDCDETIDNDLLSEFYQDTDGDGFGSDDAVILACAPDFGVALLGGDCNDSDSKIFPLATEVCDGIDNNCDGSVDEGLMLTLYLDFDEDGYGNAEESLDSCSSVDGYVENMEDCDDLETYSNPAMIEICDGMDNNCNGDVDEDSAVDVTTWYLDLDGDGFGISSEQYSCDVPSNGSLMSGDCDDSNILANPAMVEICDDIDNDCDDAIDEDSAVDVTTWYLDLDGDGFGISSEQYSCDVPSNGSLMSGDCDDSNVLVNPGAAEICDDIDNDCDEDIDEDSAIDVTTWYLDFDGDGFGLENETLDSCISSQNYVLTFGDCNDTESSISPTATEICDTIDNNCDGNIDEAEALDAKIWYADFDADGYGDLDVSATSCVQPNDFLEDSSDCDDNDDDIHPNAIELCNGEDDNCIDGIDEGFIDTDSDGERDCMDDDDDNDSYIDLQDCAPLDADVCGGCSQLCPDDSICLDETECSSGICDGVCLSPSCSDGVVNGDEADVDCGGSICEGCLVGEYCDENDDCSAGYCLSNICSVPTDCAELLSENPNTPSGIYTVAPEEINIEVYCDMETDGGGWTLWLSGSVDSLPSNQNMPRCGPNRTTECYAGTYAGRGYRAGIYFRAFDTDVRELYTDLSWSEPLGGARQDRGGCSSSHYCGGSGDRNNKCLFSFLTTAGCCTNPTQSNYCLP